MADLSKLKRRSSLGSPPPVAEASANLEAAEIAPPQAAIPDPVSEVVWRPQDGRSARRTGRTLQFATRVSPAFDERLRTIAAREGLLLVEVLERALDAYERSQKEAR